MLNKKLKHQKKQEFIAYSDGSCDNLNPDRPGGSAYIIFDMEGNEIKRMSKGFMHTTSNRMELLAIVSIINSLPNLSFVTINTDSEYCIRAILGNPKKNLDLINMYYDLRQKKDITVFLHHVKGHAGNQYNELCDQMARGEYEKMLKKSAKPKSKKKEPKPSTWTNELEEQYYNQITTKGRRKKTKKK